MKKIFSQLIKIKNWFVNQSKLKKLIIIALIIIAGWAVFQLTKKEETLSYVFASVEKRNLVETVSETGEITTDNKVDITTTITGIVREVYVQNGSQVKKGDKLFYVDSTATEAERSQALSSYQSAKAAVGQAQATQHSLQAKMLSEWEQYMDKTEEENFDDPDSEYRDLVEFHVPQKEWLAAEADYKSQTDVLAKSQAALNKAWLDYQATVDGPVKATSDGVVANLSIAKGQNVDATSQALVIKTESQTWVEVAINESDIVDIKPGQKAEVSIDALPGKTFSAAVERVDEFGTLSSDVMLYYVYLTLNEVDEQIRPGMTVQASITTQEKTDVLTVPSTAIKPYQGEKAVRTQTDTGNILYKPVVIGASDDSFVEIISGVDEGEQVIVSENNTTSSTNTSSGAMMMGPR